MYNIISIDAPDLLLVMVLLFPLLDGNLEKKKILKIITTSYIVINVFESVYRNGFKSLRQV